MPGEVQTQEIHEVGCLCGSVCYRTLGQPRYQAVCHCRFCQHFTGSAFNVEVVFLEDRVEFSGSPFATYEHRSPNHGRILRVQFCPRCGTSFGLTFERFQAAQAVTGGTLDDPNWFHVERHIFTACALSWMTCSNGMPRFTHHSLKFDGSFEAPMQAECSTGPSLFGVQS